MNKTDELDLDYELGYELGCKVHHLAEKLGCKEEDTYNWIKSRLAKLDEIEHNLEVLGKRGDFNCEDKE